MIHLDDPRWLQLKGGYRRLYNPAPALRKLESGVGASAIWDELWLELHHQADVDEASYAAVPHLVRIQRELGGLGWNFYSLISTIEIERHRKGNPPLPGWLKDDYSQAWRDVLPMALADVEAGEDELLIRTALATVAIAKRHLKFGAILLKWDKSELDELLEQFFAWSERYG